MKKNRVPISADQAAEVLYAFDRTCCICNERGKTTQIHHIDDDPSNNNNHNLAVLCLECHNDTLIKGGFGRKLDKKLVIKYRNEWLLRIQKRREDADALAVSKMSEVNLKILKVSDTPHLQKCSDTVIEYVNSLPKLRKELLKKAKLNWDSGITSQVVSASYEYVDSLQGILIILAHFYPSGHFGGYAPHKFFSELISSRYTWHRSHLEPYGLDTEGSVVNVTMSGLVISDVEAMIEDMSRSLLERNNKFNWQEWSKLWNEEFI